MGWLVAQIGARERYAVPRGLSRHASLDRFYTDAWCRLPTGLVSRLPGGVSRYANRAAPGLGPVRSFELRMGLGQLTAKARLDTAQPGAHELAWADAGQRFSSLVRDDLRRYRLNPRQHAFFAHTTGALESIAYLRDRGVPTIVGQLEPVHHDAREVAVERTRWPCWEGPPPTLRDEYVQRLRAEWAAAAAVVVHSAWSRQSALEQGCPPDKLFVIPHAYEPAVPVVTTPRLRSGRRLQALWLGQVVLRKGIPYLLEAARRLPAVDFVVAGRIGVAEGVLRDAAPPNVRILGPVSERVAIGLRAAADLFVLPTVSDGFALTQLEAMAAGLPVIATDRCGEVVSDGVDGFVVPVRDAGALAAAIGRLDDDRALLAEFSGRAPAKVRKFTHRHYVDELQKVLGAVYPESLLARPEISGSLAEESGIHTR